MLPGPSGKRRAWTRADQLLIDEANSLLNGSPFTYGHVIVDEAQDHSDVALRVIGRRTPAGSAKRWIAIKGSFSCRWSWAVLSSESSGHPRTLANKNAVTIGARSRELLVEIIGFNGLYNPDDPASQEAVNHQSVFHGGARQLAEDLADGVGTVDSG